MKLLQWTIARVLISFLCTVSIFTCVISVGAKLAESEILLLNRPLDVYFGRTALLDHDSLRINVRSGDTCVLKVISNGEELSYRPGQLSRSEFSCNFGPEEVRYIHYGGRGYNEDRVDVLLRYDSANDTFIIPFSIYVRIHEKTSDIILEKKAIIIDRQWGYTAQIDPFVLDVGNNNKGTRCVLSIIPPSSGLPQYGMILNVTNPQTKVDCHTFLTYGIQYKLKEEIKSGNIDFIPMHVQLLRDSGEIVDEEYFQLEVIINTGKPNTPPKASMNANFIIDSINQYGLTAITPDAVSATDDETPADRLLFRITQPLGPGEGHIVNTDDRNTPITSFYQHDINSLKVAYRPPSSDSSIQRIVQLGLTIYDPDGLSSFPIQLMILVTPRNTLAPGVRIHTRLHLIEGHSTPITSPDVLEISDLDNLDDVTITTAGGLRNGYLTIPAGKSSLTPKDLTTGLVVYHHDDTETYSDNIIFRLSDGTHEIDFLLPVTVYPKDDIPPVLVTNAGLEVNRRGHTLISTSVLNAIDFDTDDAFVTYVLEEPMLKTGIVVVQRFEMPPNVKEWQFEDGYYELAVTSFTQKDLAQGKVFYKHKGAYNHDTIVDRMKFSLLDNGIPPNKSTQHELKVMIFPIDDVPPFQADTLVPLEISSQKLTSIRRKNLRYSDALTNDREIMYIITQQPFDTYTEISGNAGLVVNCDKAERPIYRFSQAEVNQQKICFRSPDTETTLTTRMVQFKFDVEDQARNRLENQFINILIEPVQHQVSKILNSELVMLNTDQVTVTTKHLNVVVDDSEEQRNIAFLLASSPSHGTLFKGDTVLTAGSGFRYVDLISNIIVYRKAKDSNEVLTENLHMVISYHSQVVQVTFKITLIPQEVTVEARVGKMHISLQVFEKQSVVLKDEYFNDLERNSSAADVLYSVKNPPRYGELLRNGSPTRMFTHRDVQRNIITYKHSAAEIGINSVVDYVNITVDNNLVRLPDGSRLSEIIFKITLQPVDDTGPEISVKENIDVIEGSKADVLSKHFSVTDIDTSDSDILCLVTDQPKKGFLENTATSFGSSSAISSFTFRDIRNRSISYVQHIHKGNEPTSDNFGVQCTDGLKTTGKARLRVTIHPRNDEEPIVYAGGLTVYEGGKTPINTTKLSVTDLDKPEDSIIFIITKEPKHGYITKNTGTERSVVQNFTLDDIKATSVILYHHDDSETPSDSFELVVTDGVHRIRETMLIDIIAVDDQAPRLEVNNGLVIDNIGETKVITKNILAATDEDSVNDNITFILKRVPDFGILAKVIGSTRINLLFGSNFTQQDIDRNLIEYTHTGNTTNRDLLKFDITDGLNTLSDKSFTVTIKGLDILYPEVVSHGLQLPVDGILVIPAEITSNKDVVVTDENLIYVITKTPEHGFLDFVDQPGRLIQTFSQTDLVERRLQYIHNEDDGMKMDSFEFEVPKRGNHSSKTFKIAVIAPDNKLPVVLFTNMRLKEGENRIITLRVLKAVDIDTDDSKIKYTITQVPLHGNLLYNCSKIVYRFSQKDLHDKLISYQHDGTETLSDSFIFTVTDGTNMQFYVPGVSIPTRQPQELDIAIIPVDTGIPHAKVNREATTLTAADSVFVFTFTSEYLQYVDRDNKGMELRYTLSVLPKHGFIQNIQNKTLPITTWTQGEFSM